MHFIPGLATFLSLALLTSAGNHKSHLNRQKHDELAKRATGNGTIEKRFSGSKWSYYDAQTGNAGACGRHIGNNEWAVALNTPQYGGGYPGPECGKTITLSYGGKTAQAVILDQCPGCPWGGLDLTPALFEYFAPHSVGIIYGEWNFGGGEPAPPPPPPPPTTTYQPPPPPTTTWQPAPTPTTTWQPPPPAPTTQSQAPPPSSSSSRSSSAAASSSALASVSLGVSIGGSARPTGSAVPPDSLVGGNRQNQSVLGDLAKAFVAMGNIGAQGAAVNSSN